MKETLRILNSPLRVEIAFGVAFERQVPYSDSAVTLQVIPNTTPKDTQILTFDFESQRSHTVRTDGRKLTIELVTVGVTELDGRKVLFWQFEVSDE